MPKKAFEMQDVIVGEEKYGGATIRTCTIGDPSLPKLVLIHGYGGSLVLWFSVIKDLSKKFRLYLIDIPGMGASSRVPFTGTTKKETDDFFTDLLEDWRKEMDITDFFLAAHSYGGYLSGIYTLKYP